MVLPRCYSNLPQLLLFPPVPPYFPIIGHKKVDPKQHKIATIDFTPKQWTSSTKC